MKKIPMIGKRFGRLSVVAEEGRTKTGMVRWLCECDCGKTIVVRGTHLRQGLVSSCGCFRREASSERNKTHGKKNSRIYRTWRNMKTRCFNHNHEHYKDYGGRGITVCKEWQNSFEAFLEYVSNLPHFGEPGYSLDRINNDGNYEPGNVRWATAKEQRNNQRKRKA